MIHYFLLVKNHFLGATENGEGAWVSSKPQHAAGNGHHAGGVHGLVSRGVRFHLPGGRLCIEIRILQTHQVQVLFIFSSCHLFFLKRFTKARDIEEKNIVSTRDGSYYMENNCVHGKKPHNFTQQPQFQWPELNRIIAYLLIDSIAWFLNLARRGGELDISKNQEVSLGCNVCTCVYICGNSIGIRWHDDQPVSEQKKSKE